MAEKAFGTKQKLKFTHTFEYDAQPHRRLITSHLFNGSYLYEGSQKNTQICYLISIKCEVKVRPSRFISERRTHEDMTLFDNKT